MEFQIGEYTYRAGRIPAKEQFHLSLHLAPLISAIMASGQIKAPAPVKEGEAPPPADPEQALKVAGAVLNALGDLPVAKADAIMFGLLKHAKRKMPGGLGWADVVVGTELNHIDIGVLDMFTIARQVFTENLSDFMPALRRILPAGSLSQSAS